MLDLTSSQVLKALVNQDRPLRGRCKSIMLSPSPYLLWRQVRVSCRVSGILASHAANAPRSAQELRFMMVLRLWHQRFVLGVRHLWRVQPELVVVLRGLFTAMELARIYDLSQFVLVTAVH